MHLYEQKGDTINVYNYNTNGKKVIDFKKKEQYFISASNAKHLSQFMTRSSINGYIFDCETSSAIQLTEKLYSLQLLVQNNCNAILKDTITDEMLELMSLFEFTEEPIRQFNIRTLNELCQFGLLPKKENDKIKKKVWQSTKLLQKVRETHKK